MGQLTSKETAGPSEEEAARLNEVDAERRKNGRLLETLTNLAAAEKAAGKPVPPGISQACLAVWDYSKQLGNESHAIRARLSECLCGSSVLV